MAKFKYRVNVKSRRVGRDLGRFNRSGPFGPETVQDYNTLTERPAKWPRFVRLLKWAGDYWVSFDPTDRADADVDWYKLDTL